MNKVLQDLGYEKNPSFTEIFNNEISKKVVVSYWEKLIKERNLGLFSITISLKDILRSMYLANQKIKPNRAIYLLGLFMVGKDDNGMRELRSIIAKKSNQRTWYRIAKDMQFASQLITKNKLRNWVAQIDKKLEDYKPFKIKQYENKK